jgi:hypothetical protein
MLEQYNTELFITIKEILISKGDKYNTHLHDFAYALNPKYYDDTY